MVTIRHAAADDAEGVAAIHVRGWQVGYAGLMPADVLTALDPADFAARWRDRFAAGGPFITLVADLGDTLAGFVTVGPYRNGQNSDDLDFGYGEILAIYVEPARWRSGVGSALLARACTELTTCGFAEARLWVLEDNVRARRFYERAGLVPDGQRSVYALRGAADQPPVQLPEVRYARRLGP